MVYAWRHLVKGLWLCLWKLWHSVINTTQHMHCVMLIMEWRNSHKHSQSPLTSLHLNHSQFLRLLIYLNRHQPFLNQIIIFVCVKQNLFFLNYFCTNLNQVVLSKIGASQLSLPSIGLMFEPLLSCLQISVRFSVVADVHGPGGTI